MSWWRAWLVVRTVVLIPAHMLCGAVFAFFVCAVTPVMMAREQWWDETP